MAYRHETQQRTPMCASSRDQRETFVPTSPIIRGSTLPSSQKSVRFKDSDSELDPHSDTESETESEFEDASFTQPVAAVPVPVPLEVTNLSLESLSLLRARPPLLRGIVHVRNIAYEKHVAVRFTFDRWVTTSEAQRGYVGPTVASSDANSTWDQFVFNISLEFCVPRPGALSRTLLLAVQLVVPGVGEWWDNNGGNDFCVVLIADSMGSTKPPGLLTLASASGYNGSDTPMLAGFCVLPVVMIRSFGNGKVKAKPMECNFRARAGCEERMRVFSIVFGPVGCHTDAEPDQTRQSLTVLQSPAGTGFANAEVSSESKAGQSWSYPGTKDQATSAD
ncbi:putative phosphatase regulatory subunit-domain-containing protein [Russula compacta]|nr:putative phosphatase regulatory subunit-domain-containing protein [Russula compacta]